MAESLKKELQRKLDLQGDTSHFNPELTAKYAAEDKYVRFNKWAKESGVKADAVMYPAAFGKCGLIGVAAARDIGPDEPMMFIPSKMLINEQKVEASPLGPILKTH